MAKDFFSVIKERRSIRKYKDRDISKELIEKIIDAARWAPSGMNSQPWQFVVIKDKAKLRRIREMYIFGREKLGIYPQDATFIERTTVIIVCSSKENRLGITNCYLAIENILLAATALGLGSLCLGALMIPENVEKMRKMCNVPANLEIVLAVAIGYADEKQEPKERKGLKEILHYESF